MDVDLGCRESIFNPASYFAAAREQGVVQWSETHRGWVILSHAEVEAGFRDVRLSSDRSGVFARAAQHYSAGFQRVVELLSGWMNFNDPPVHTRLRAPIKNAFTPRRVLELEPEIRRIVNDTLDAIEGDTADLAEDFAAPIPALVIAALMGVPPSERHRFHKWSEDLGRLVFALSPHRVDEEPVLAATDEFSAFFGELLDRERDHPTGSLLSAIVHAEGLELSKLELVGACTLLLFGGHETTTTLLGNALELLLKRPDLMTWLREHPEADATAIEEFMRVCGPARSMPRKVGVSHERGGQWLEEGQSVYLGIAAANHDPAVFENPERVDLTRDPNPQLGFGWGLHFCLGANLARLEARIALRTLLDRFPSIEVGGEIPEVKASAMGFGRRPLPVRVKRA